MIPLLCIGRNAERVGLSNIASGQVLKKRRVAGLPEISGDTWYFGLLVTREFSKQFSCGLVEKILINAFPLLFLPGWRPGNLALLLPAGKNENSLSDDHSSSTI